MHFWRCAAVAEVSRLPRDASLCRWMVAFFQHQCMLKMLKRLPFDHHPLRRYVFLVDAQGRLRWRGSGNPSDSELATLLRCTEELLQQEGAAAEGRQGRQPAAAGAAER